MVQNVGMALFMSLGVTIWLYVIARVVTRGITRTLDEQKRRKSNAEKED